MAPDRTHPRQRPPLGLYALANIGGVAAYLPLLTLLVPMKVEAVSPDGRIALLSLVAVLGAATASLANILFGWLSDRSQRAGRGRRRLMAIGLAGVAASYAAIGMAATPVMLVAAILFFQFAVNALLAPLMAIMAEEIPDAKRGLTGGLIALGNPVASALSTWLVGETLLGEQGRLAALVMAVMLCVLPLLLVGAGGSMSDAGIAATPSRPSRQDFIIAGVARLCVQVAAVVTQVYLLYYFETIVPPAEYADLPRWVGRVFTCAFVLPLPIALLLGRLADRMERRRDILLLAALVAALGLLAMAGAPSRLAAAAAFILYTAGSSVFVALHVGFSFQLLPDPRHRGRDLGLFNLTNSLSTIIGAGLTWTFATPQDFDVVLVMLAMVTMAGGLAILGVQAWR
ncbi:MFS transporter [Sphingomonas sp. Sph1(2015)]|jgi:MFS family permease|uniref:MFS transporter n=1 Tax=Sphingomonas sp. Sph1(2015) TaxID=1628084 RepID=UPI000975CC40|nr:MFS transporter [Sphingomonas sp. Sph1(2015)]OMJ32493.1 MFS transporter [Sphingomonas sp. Sph1(2015)]